MKNLIKEEVQSSKKVKSSKFLKTCFVGCLATCLTLTGIFAFAPLGANAQASSSSQNSSLNNNVNNSTTQTTEQTGLITPHADDPVLLTTESGLEIKYSNVPALSNEGGGVEGFASMTSGNLNNFPYFITNDGTKNYYWVIIGISTNFQTSNFVTLTSWKNSNKSSSLTYFFNNFYESESPAGSVINNQIQNDFVARKLSFSSVAESAEIPANSVLVLANDIVASSDRGVNCGYGGTGGSATWWNGHYGAKLKGLFDSYYNNSSFGLSAIKTHLVSQTRTGTEYYYPSNSSTVKTRNYSYSGYIFPLSYNDTFKWNTYLNASQVKLTSNQWLFDMLNSTARDSIYRYQFSTYYLNTSGSSTTQLCLSSAGLRPAFVLKLF